MFCCQLVVVGGKQATAAAGVGQMVQHSSSDGSTCAHNDATAGNLNASRHVADKAVMRCGVAGTAATPVPSKHCERISCHKLPCVLATT